jgi:hypothetical protein
MILFEDSEIYKRVLKAKGHRTILILLSAFIILVTLFLILSLVITSEFIILIITCVAIAALLEPNDYEASHYFENAKRLGYVGYEYSKGRPYYLNVFFDEESISISIEEDVLIRFKNEDCFHKEVIEELKLRDFELKKKAKEAEETSKNKLLLQQIKNNWN